jgi:hypothetical protein
MAHSDGGARRSPDPRRRRRLARRPPRLAIGPVTRVAVAAGSLRTAGRGRSACPGRRCRSRRFRKGRTSGSVAVTPAGRTRFTASAMPSTRYIGTVVTRSGPAVQAHRRNDVLDLPPVVGPAGREPPSEHRPVEGASRVAVGHLRRHVGGRRAGCRWGTRTVPTPAGDSKTANVVLATSRRRPVASCSSRDAHCSRTEHAA